MPRKGKGNISTEGQELLEVRSFWKTKKSGEMKLPFTGPYTNPENEKDNPENEKENEKLSGLENG
jgi:hypothetical protein